MNFLYVNTHFAPDYKYGGVVESASKIHKYTIRLIDFYAVAVSNNPDQVNSYLSDKGVCFKSVIFHLWGFSIALVIPLWKLVKSRDVIVINGIYTFPTVLAAIYALILGKPYIISPRGGLELWRLQQKHIKKYLFNLFITLPILRKAKAIHVTSEEEYRNVKALKLKHIYLIKNGIDRELFEDFAPQERKFFMGDEFVFLFMSRTDKEKGLDLLFDAYRIFSDKYPSTNHMLAIVGPDNGGYLATLYDEMQGLNIYRNTGVYGDEKLQLISESDVVLLPSYSENFGNIVVEGMAMEKPVITTQGTPWKVLRDLDLGYWIEPDSEALCRAMENVYLTSDNSRAKMGRLAREYVFSQLSWGGLAEELAELYIEIYEQASK